MLAIAGLKPFGQTKFSSRGGGGRWQRRLPHSFHISEGSEIAFIPTQFTALNKLITDTVIKVSSNLISALNALRECVLGVCLDPF